MNTKKIGIITCSNAGLDYLEHPKDIRIFRSVIAFNESEIYEDYVGISAEDFYKRLSESKNIPKTSYVSPGKMLEIFSWYKENGYDEVLVITISSSLSGLYEAVKNTANTADIKVTVFDSRGISYLQCHMVFTAYQLAEENKTMAEIITNLEKIRDNANLLFAVETLEFLIKNGRLSKVAGTLANMLKIKPLLQIDPSGKVQVVEKIRTFNKAVKAVINSYIDVTKDKDVVTYIAHANNPVVAEEIKNEILKVMPNRKIVVTYLTPVVGCHTGPGAVGIGYIKNN